jgi:hypothetical protein
MRQRAAALALALTVLLLASTVLLFVDFRLKESRGREQAASSLPTDDAGANPAPQVEAPTAPANTTPQMQESPPPTPSTPPVRSPRVDGRLRQGEYQYAYHDAEIDLWLYWTIEIEDGDEGAGMIYIGLKSPMKGWVAIAFAPTGPRMKGGDVLIGYVKDGETFVRDDYADEVVSHSADVELSPEEGQDNILARAGSSGPDGTVLELSRPLVTSDPYDKPITRGPMTVQLAYSEVPDFASYHIARTTIEIDFFTGEVTPAPVESPP